MLIREAHSSDWEHIWPIFKEVVSAGDTYVYPADTRKDEAKAIWLSKPRATYVVEEEGTILGTYYLKTNQDGPGRHVCKSGYMVSGAARGKGLATTMCNHSQDVARDFGYKAMQFNFVASSNEDAVRLWNKFGFATVGTLPKAFRHPQQGYVDALVMYKWLEV
ncbi:MAG: GNAT family N-acetyltransferase [Halioglobus sp.]